MVLQYLEGVDDAEIAALLGTSQPRVASLASRALETLRIQIASEQAASASIVEANRGRNEDHLRGVLTILADQPLDAAALNQSINAQLKRRPSPCSWERWLYSSAMSVGAVQKTPIFEQHRRLL